MAELNYATRVNFAAAGLYAGPSPTVTLAGGGANVKITSTAHGLFTGQTIALSGTTGVTGLNANWPIKVLDANNYELVGSSALTGTPAGAPAVALPDLDISGLNKEWRIRVKVYGSGVITLEDTVNNWSASERRFLFNAQNTDEGQEFIVNWYEWSGGHRFGTASAKLRARLLSGTNVKVSISVSTNG